MQHICSYRTLSEDVYVNDKGPLGMMLCVLICVLYIYTLF